LEKRNCTVGCFAGVSAYELFGSEFGFGSPFDAIAGVLGVFDDREVDRTIDAILAAFA
jgi:hypothetical protein